MFITELLSLSLGIVALNIVLLRKNYSLLLCGHIINLLCFTMITICNIWLGGESASSLSWFYISPIIAAVTIGIDGLIIYGFLAATMLTVFTVSDFSPLYLFSENYLHILNKSNLIFIFVLTCTILYHLLIENKQYESLLKEKNFLLHADKQKFHYLSHHDSLTNLPNRSYFNAHLQELIDSTDIEKYALSLYFMDLNGFKKINDRYGHEIGDLLLLQVSKRLQSCFRENDFIARLGGDEFTAIIKHHHNDNITAVLEERIKKEFKAPFPIKNLDIKCSISIGKARYPFDAKEAEILLKNADESMYKNKKKSRSIKEQVPDFS